MENKESKETKKNAAELNDDALEPVSGGADTGFIAMPKDMILFFEPDELLGPEAEKLN